MNCHEFESTFNDIAREALIDAGARRDADTHAEACPPCAALLNDARTLTAGLRALSSDTAGAEAPPRVEANLLAAFRAHAAGLAAKESGVLPVAVAPVKSSPVVPLTVKKWSWPKTFGAAGLAAAAAVAFVLLVPPALFGPPTKLATKPADSRQPEPTNITVPPIEQASDPSDVVEVPLKEDAVVAKVQTPPRGIPTPRGQRNEVMRNAAYGAARDNAGRTNAPAPTAEANSEIVTDFIQLTDSGGFVAGEGAHLIRVELPRTALVRFGLPLNAERVGGRVKADVLIGEDGMARAIRFVR